MHACVVAPAYNHHKHKGPPTSIIYPPLHPAQPPSSIIGKPTHSLTHLPSNQSIQPFPNSSKHPSGFQLTNPNKYASILAHTYPSTDWMNS